MDNLNQLPAWEKPVLGPVYGEFGQRLTAPMDSCPNFKCAMCGSSAEIDGEHNCPVFMDRVPCRCQLCASFRGEFGCLNPVMRAN